jgi:hypothetical protein
VYNKYSHVGTGGNTFQLTDFMREVLLHLADTCTLVANIAPKRPCHPYILKKVLSKKNALNGRLFLSVLLTPFASVR